MQAKKGERQLNHFSSMKKTKEKMYAKKTSGIFITCFYTLK
ncbi:hypothetical protein HMPREF1869_00261 [Bacteroidales bacterium KA00251]|nr:hypothetical protein HMPREF1869_00261 [Bacteroidales bacterium KA00251]